MDWLTGISAAGSFMSGLGGLMGSSGDGVSGKALGAQRVQNWKLMEQQKQYLWDMLPYQKQTEQQSYDTWIKNMYPIQQRQIQDRVADAKNAGLHPLFALGQPSSNLPSFTAGGSLQSPGTMSGIPGQSVTGSHKGDKLMAAGNALMGLQQNLANVKLTEAQTAYYNSLVKKTEQQADVTAQTKAYIPGFGEGADLQYESIPTTSGVIRNVPGRNPSRNTGDSTVVAGSQPAWMRIETRPGKYIEVPYSEDEGWAEAASNPAVWPLIIMRNGWNSAKYLYDKYFK